MPHCAAGDEGASGVCAPPRTCRCVWRQQLVERLRSKTGQVYVLSLVQKQCVCVCPGQYVSTVALQVFPRPTPQPTPCLHPKLYTPHISALTLHPMHLLIPAVPPHPAPAFHPLPQTQIPYPTLQRAVLPTPQAHTPLPTRHPTPVFSHLQAGAGDTDSAEESSDDVDVKRPTNAKA